MKQKTNLGKFKEQLINMINYIKDLFPDDLDLLKMQKKLIIGLDVDPKLICNIFVNNTIGHARHIFEDNEDYFLDMDYNKLLNDDNESNKDTNLDLNNFTNLEKKLKVLWKCNLNNDDKEKIKKYFKLLLILGCLTTKNEQLLDIINSFREVPLEFD